MRYGILMAMTNFELMAFAYMDVLMGQWGIIVHDTGVHWHHVLLLFRYSRKMLWLEVSSTNHNPRIVVDYYLNAIDKYKGNQEFVWVNISQNGHLMPAL